MKRFIGSFFVLIVLFATETKAPPVPGNATGRAIMTKLGIPIYDNGTASDATLIDSLQSTRTRIALMESTEEVRLVNEAWNRMIADLRSRPLSGGAREALSFLMNNVGNDLTINLTFREPSAVLNPYEMNFGLFNSTITDPTYLHPVSGRRFQDILVHELGHILQHRSGISWLGDVPGTTQWDFIDLDMRVALTEFHGNLIQTGYDFDAAYSMTTKSYRSVPEYLSQYLFDFPEVKALSTLTSSEAFRVLVGINKLPTIDVAGIRGVVSQVRAGTSSIGAAGTQIGQLIDHDARLASRRTTIPANDIAQVETILRESVAAEERAVIRGLTQTDVLRYAPDLPRLNYYVDYYIDQLKVNGGTAEEAALLRFMVENKDRIEIRFREQMNYDFAAEGFQGKYVLTLNPQGVMGVRSLRLRGNLLGSLGTMREQLTNPNSEYVRNLSTADPNVFSPTKYVADIRGYTYALDGDLAAATDRTTRIFEINAPKKPFIGPPSFFEAMGLSEEARMVLSPEKYNALNSAQKLAFAEMLMKQGSKITESGFVQLPANQQVNVLTDLSRKADTFFASPPSVNETSRPYVNSGTPIDPLSPVDRALSNPGKFIDIPGAPQDVATTTRIRIGLHADPALGDPTGNAPIEQIRQLLSGGSSDLSGFDIMVQRVNPGTPVPARPGSGENIVWIEAVVPTSELKPIPGSSDTFTTDVRNIAPNVKRVGIFPNAADLATASREALAVKAELEALGHRPQAGSNGEAFFNELKRINDQMTWGTPDPKTGSRPCANCGTLNSEYATAYQRYLSGSADISLTPSGTAPNMDSIVVTLPNQTGGGNKVTVYNQFFQSSDGSAAAANVLQNTGNTAGNIKISQNVSTTPQPVQQIISGSVGNPATQTIVAQGGDPLGSGIWAAAATESLGNTFASSPGLNGAAPSGLALGGGALVLTGINPTSYGFDGKPATTDLYYNRVPGGTTAGSQGFPTPSEFGAQSARVSASAATVSFASQMGLMVAPATLMAYADRRLSGGTQASATLAGMEAFANSTISPHAMTGLGSMMAEAALINQLANSFDPAVTLARSMMGQATPGALASGAFNTAAVGAMMITSAQTYGGLYQKDAATYDLGNAAIFADPNWHSDDLSFPSERHIALFSMALGEVGNDISNAQRGVLSDENSVYYNTMAGAAANISEALTYLNPANWAGKIEVPPGDPMKAMMNSFASNNSIPAIDFSSNIGASWKTSSEQAGTGNMTFPNSSTMTNTTLKNFQSLSNQVLQANDPNYLTSAGAPATVTKAADPAKAASEVAKVKDGQTVPETGKSLTDAEFTAAKTVYNSLENLPKVAGVDSLGTEPELPPVITTQPVSQNKSLGQSVTFSVVATGTNPTYSWRKDGIPNGGVLSSLTINNVQMSNEGGYSVVVTTSKGSVTSNTAELKILPTITRQPDAAGAVITAQAGTPLTLYVEAVGSNLSYQWYFKGVSLGAGAAFASITNPKLFLSNSGAYYCIVTSSLGSVTSNAVTVNVIP